MAAPPSFPPMENSDNFNPDFNTGPAPSLTLGPTSAPVEDGALSSPVDGPAPVSSEHQVAPADAQIQQRVQDVLHSDSGVSTLLNRLKASIASARVSTSPPVLHQLLILMVGLLQLSKAAGRA